MPIRKERKHLYPKNWKEIVKQINERAGNRCEGSPDYPDCRAENGNNEDWKTSLKTGTKKDVS